MQYSMGGDVNVKDLVVIIMNDMECVNLLPTLGDWTIFNKKTHCFFFAPIHRSSQLVCSWKRFFWQVFKDGTIKIILHNDIF